MSSKTPMVPTPVWVIPPVDGMFRVPPDGIPEYTEHDYEGIDYGAVGADEPHARQSTILKLIRAVDLLAEGGGSGNVVTGPVDNAVLRADGTGGKTSQGSSIVISDATTGSGGNVQIAVHSPTEANSDLVLSPQGPLGAFIVGPRPDGGAGGNHRGNSAVDIQTVRDSPTEVASGPNSVAIGTRCKSLSYNTIAIGNGAQALDDSGISLGHFSYAIYKSVAVGSQAKAVGYASIAIGQDAISEGTDGVAIGVGSSAASEFCIAVGKQATAEDEQSIAIGVSSRASFGSYALGKGAKALLDASIAIGETAEASNAGAIAIGKSSAGIGSHSVALGEAAVSEADRSIAIGDGAVAHADDSIAIGLGAATQDNDGVAVGSGTSASGGAVALGKNANAGGDQSVSIGQDSHASFAEGVAVGKGAKALVSFAVVVGNSQAVGSSSVAIGNGNTTIATGAMAMGSGCYGAAKGAVALGVNAVANRMGMLAHGSLIGRTLGQMALGANTTTATPTELTSNGFAANPGTIDVSNKVILEAYTILFVDAFIVGTSANGTVAAAFHRRAAIRRDGANNTTLIGAVQTVGTDLKDAGASAWQATMQADNVGEALQVMVTGAAGVNINWLARLNITEMSQS